MEDNKKKCSNEEHINIDAISYCENCKIYICNKCSNLHQGLFKKHIIYNIDNSKEIFIDKCEENNHNNKLEFYCKNHNKLCCVACISKIKTNGYGQHKDCDVCILQDIKEEKKKKLKNNIKFLEDLSINLNNSIKKFKKLYDEIDKRKDELKTKIQNIFTKIRTALNEREDELLLEVDNKYKELYGNTDIIKDCEKLPNKIKSALEDGKLIDNEWNDNNKLSLLIYKCNNIELKIKNINMMNENIKYNKINKDIIFEYHIENEYLEELMININNFGRSNNFNIRSLILKKREELDKFYNLLSRKIKIKKKNLLYRASRDGLNLSNLRDRINNKSNLIFLFLTGNTRIFGSFISAKIEVEHQKYIKDENAFVFCLNNNKIYKILIPEYAIYFYEGYPLLIGNNWNGNGFWINSSIFDEHLLTYPIIYDFQKNNELTEGKNEFNELEIFEIN